MDALVTAALAKVNAMVSNAENGGHNPVQRKANISKAVNAVDALKSALKAL